MNDPEDFLTRWSRRKRAVADESEKPAHQRDEQGAPETPSADQDANTAASQPVAPSDSTDPVFDVSKLPPIESITAATDIRPFLAPGVPAELRLAALRRAWVADPKVRDFVGLNDYDFDFHTPGAIPGFGSLEMTDALRREVARMISGWQPEPEATRRRTTVAAASDHPPPQIPSTAAKNEQRPNESAETTAVEATDVNPEHPAPAQDELIPAQATTQRNKLLAAPQKKHSPAEDLRTPARRGHGRALPE
jgi:uncharacterized protein DUF3306